MPRIFLILLFIFQIIFIRLYAQNANESKEKSDTIQFPTSFHYVTDQAKIFSLEEKVKLEQKLKAYKDSTSTQIAVVTIETLGGQKIATYAVDLANKWGVGQKGKDNGLLILISKKEQGIHITTGYGVEGTISDLAAKKIISDIMKPNFKEEKFYKGVDLALDKIFSLLSGEFEVSDVKSDSFWNFWRIGLYLILLMTLFLVYNTASHKDWKYREAYVIGGVIFWVMLIEFLSIYLIKNNILYFVLTLVGMFIIIYFHDRYRSKRSKIFVELSSVESLLEHSKKWNYLKKTYVPSEVEQKRQEFISELESIKNDYKKLDRLYSKIEHVFNMPVSYFSKRENTNILKGAEAFRSSSFTKTATHQEYFKKTSEELETFFEEKIRDGNALNQEDEEKLEQWEQSFLKDIDKYKNTYRYIQSKLNDDKHWEELRTSYHDFTKIEVQLEHLKLEFQKLENIKTFEKLNELHYKVYQFYENPEKFAKKRLDIDLLDLSNNLRLQSIFDSEAYLEKYRIEAKTKLDKELAYFSKQNDLDDFKSETDRKRYRDTLTYFQSLKSKPYDLLTLDKSYLKKYIERYFREKSWNNYYRKYTTDSVKAKVQKLKDNYAEVQSDNDIYNIYASIRNFQFDPNLQKRPKYETSSSKTYSSRSKSGSTTRSSDSSWSDSDLDYSDTSSSWSSSSDDNEYWGGGSFGGGGASGSW